MNLSKPIFFIGMPRSGTTLLFEYFALHEELAWLSQYSNRLPHLQLAELLPMLLDRVSPGIRTRKAQGQKRNWQEKFLPRPVEGYPLWERYCGEQFLWDAAPERGLTEAKIRKTRAAIGKIVTYRRKKRFAAKFTGPCRIAALNHIFPDALFVHVIRDGRAVADSLLRVPFWKDNGGYEYPFWRNFLNTEDLRLVDDARSRPTALAAAQWVRMIEQTREMARQLEVSRYMEMRYEDFVTSPKECLQALFQFATLPVTDGAAKYVEAMPKPGNMNYKYLDIAEEQIALMNQIMGKMLEQCGY